MYRPACRINQTGVRSVSSPRAARTKISRSNTGSVQWAWTISAAVPIRSTPALSLSSSDDVVDVVVVLDVTVDDNCNNDDDEMDDDDLDNTDFEFEFEFEAADGENAVTVTVVATNKIAIAVVDDKSNVVFIFIVFFLCFFRYRA
mmetsp:Transcript_9913/g.10679  ORF Transcript_9913/g.10679 Transcript_9913/m.10679 type:complete len:145 (+) Transcript_9913:823-1257(+)